MYALALTLATSIPFFRLGELDVGIPIQSFGVIVAVGVLVGAGLLRRYAEWHGVSDEHIRGVTGWVTVTGFIGAHLFDTLAYRWDEMVKDPIILVKIWTGISSYGGFLGGAFGFFFYVWWKKLNYRVMADITLIGLLVAFSIGRIGCTVVSDHIGAEVDPSKWYAFLAMDYPMNKVGREIAEMYAGRSHALLWNLGLVEFLYLVPINLGILWYAFRPARAATEAEKDAAKAAAKARGLKKADVPEWTDVRNAGTITVLIGLLYAPVRFFMDFLRPEFSDPRHFGLTFAQWISILAFGVVTWFAMHVLRNGKPAHPVGRTAGEVQAALKVILKEDPREDDPKAVEKIEKKKAAEKADLPSAKATEKSGKKVAEPAKKDPKLAVTVPEDEPEDEELAKEALAAGKAEADDDAKKS
jgi:phosphatidylglycerol---prolipoprotein diacylglyceryl transferase